MKAITFLLTAILSLQMNFIFAGNDDLRPAAENTTTILASLAPVTPAEATFEEADLFDMRDLVPVTPAEASFEEMVPVLIPFAALSPVTPAEADFE